MIRGLLFAGRLCWIARYILFPFASALCAVVIPSVSATLSANTEIAAGSPGVIKAADSASAIKYSLTQPLCLRHFHNLIRAGSKPGHNMYQKAL
jgi:hypothetical protein